MDDDMHEISAHHDELMLEHSHRTRALQALICGVLTGFSIGILIAPSRGADTRRRLTSAARAGYDRTRRFLRRKRQPSIAAVAPLEHARETALADEVPC
jgi:hypothetical protein